ncbi:hypothetical protein CJ030_MR8G028124 [Morella rubra]|uniref:Uncharacterized protein n=1 Tax=Morella rubra TaxID=262757 RepID=A0A6A1UZG8_9ROSI|nr:hypothetical protein CJ030_MR8G028124 [Morella rubra]
MGIKKWWSSDAEVECIQLGRQRSYHDNKRTQPRWQTFWKKITREKKKFSRPQVSFVRASTYDPKTYTKNFDQGTGSMEPDNLPRSFSARFADSSRVLRIENLLD